MSAFLLEAVDVTFFLRVKTLLRQLQGRDLVHLHESGCPPQVFHLFLTLTLKGDGLMIWSHSCLTIQRNVNSAGISGENYPCVL